MIKKVVAAYKPEIAKETLRKYTICYSKYIKTGNLVPANTDVRTHNKASEKALGKIVYQNNNYCVRENPLKEVLDLDRKPTTAIKAIMKRYYKGNTQSIKKVTKRYKDYVEAFA